VPTADQTRTPLLDAVLNYAESEVTRFHMPGHKGGRAVNDRLLQALGPKTWAMDATGVLGLDDLHQPGGVIQEAQELAAAAFGADHTFFLVNGTSAGVQAMILSACAPGDKIIIGRNLHKSAQAGLVLSGAQPVYIQPEVDPELGIGLGLAPASVADAIRRHPDAAAVLVVSPTYHGIASDLAAIAGLTHKAGMLLLVDEAHGAHFRFHSALPRPGALEAGADMAAHGIHKVLGGLTQASMLHVKGGRVDLARVRRVLQALQSTSASYLLLASLDAARRDAALQGERLLSGPLEWARLLRRGVAGLAPLRTFGRELVGRPGCAGLDELKVNVDVTGLGLTGQEAEVLLRRRYGIQAEMLDLAGVLFMLGPGSGRKDVEVLLGALEDLVQTTPGTDLRPGARAVLPPPPPPPLPPSEITPREAFFRPSEAVPLDEAEDRIAAELVTCYPPGIPLIGPGERVTAQVLEQMRLVAEGQLRVSGPADGSLATLRVLKEGARHGRASGP